MQVNEVQILKLLITLANSLTVSLSDEAHFVYTWGQRKDLLSSIVGGQSKTVKHFDVDDSEAIRKIRT